MFHKNVLSPKVSTHPDQNPTQNPAGLSLVRHPVRPDERLQAPTPTPAFFDLAIITARRCSGFFAEAAVLVLVFGVLDLLVLKGHPALSRTDLPWVAGALAISLGLLAASIATDFGAQRWIKAHP